MCYLFDTQGSMHKNYDKLNSITRVAMFSLDILSKETKRNISGVIFQKQFSRLVCVEAFDSEYETFHSTAKLFRLNRYVLTLVVSRLTSTPKSSSKFYCFYVLIMITQRKLYLCVRVSINQCKSGTFTNA